MKFEKILSIKDYTLGNRHTETETYMVCYQMPEDGSFPKGLCFESVQDALMYIMLQTHPESIISAAVNICDRNGKKDVGDLLAEIQFEPDKAGWLKDRLPLDNSDLLSDKAYVEFMYKAMHDHCMDMYDADEYAWLNTLFGYDIGADYARRINSLFYDIGVGIMELNHNSLQDVKSVCKELGIKPDLRKWAKEEPEAIRYSF